MKPEMKTACYVKASTDVIVMQEPADRQRVVLGFTTNRANSLRTDFHAYTIQLSPEEAMVLAQALMDHAEVAQRNAMAARQNQLSLAGLA